MYSIYATHHDEKHWNNPEQFDPDRFAPGVKPQPYTFVPFGGGPRNCIGAAFAQVEAKVVLARILQRFKLRLLQEDFRVYMGATLEPRPGVLMQVSPRR
jgi:cytochrome P450